MGRVSVPQNPYLNAMTVQGFTRANQFLGDGPTTVVPQELKSNVSYASGTLGAKEGEKNLPTFLQMNENNDLFNGNAAQLQSAYQRKLYDASMAPQLGAEAINQYLGGNLGTNGSSSFGANYMSNLEASAAQNAFFGGQQYYDDLLNNMLNMRSNYYTTAVAPEIQAQEFNAQNNLNALGMINNYKLDAAGTMMNQAQIAGNLNNTQSQLGMQAQAASGANLGNLIGGIGGLLGGGLGMMGGGGKGGMSSAIPSAVNVGRSQGGGVGNILGGMGGMSSGPFSTKGFTF